MSDIWLPTLSPPGKQFPKAWEVFNCYKRYLLVAGSRKGAKTLTVGHKVWRHLWDTHGARVALFAVTIKSAKQGGVWEDVLNIVGKPWLQSGLVGDTGLPIAFTTKDGEGNPGPRSDPQSRSVFFRIRNRYGGESEMILFSLDDVNETEAKVRGTRFSLVWFTEGDNFKDRKIFNLSIQQLRMPHLPFEAHQWIMDSNPSDEGPDSWIYKLWYEERVRNDHPKPEFQKNLHLIEMSFRDNPWLKQEERDELEGTYCDDPTGHDRYVNGNWVIAGNARGPIFLDVLLPRHFPEGSIDVAESTHELFTGWDLGNVNNSFHIIEKRVVDGGSVWLILEELVTVGEQISTSEFTLMALEKMRMVEAHHGRKFRWMHWSDSSALTTYRAGTDGYDATEVLKASEGQINLVGADKPSGSVKTCIKIIRRLLIENRLYVGTNCPQTIAMLRKIRSGPKGGADDSGGHIHAFDSMRYPIYMEERQDLVDDARVRTSSRTIISHI